MADIDVSSQIMEALETYGEDVTRGINREAKRCADGLKKDLRRSSPKRTGKYAKSWQSKKTSEYPGGGEGYTIYNNKNYQLTHLLEHGHAGPHGHGFVAARPHIATAEKRWNQEFEEAVEEVIENG